MHVYFIIMHTDNLTKRYNILLLSMTIQNWKLNFCNTCIYKTVISVIV